MFLQGICCDYLLFRHLDKGVPPEAIRIRQEVALGAGVFADVEVRAGQAPPYFVEVEANVPVYVDHRLAGAWGAGEHLFWFWHAPAVFDPAVARHGLHALRHSSFFGRAGRRGWHADRPPQARILDSEGERIGHSSSASAKDVGLGGAPAPRP